MTDATPGRVLMVSSLWPPAVVGGAERYASDLACHLRGRGIEVASVTLGVSGDDVAGSVTPLPHQLDRHRSTPAWRQAVFHAADLWHPLASRQLAAAVARFRPDVVHSHVVTGMSTRALALPSRLGVAHVHTLHDYWLRCWRSTGTRRDQRPCGPACRALAVWRRATLVRHHPHVVVGISHAILDRHGRRPAGSAAGRVVLHPADDAAPAERPGRTGAPVFGFLGQLNPNKGLDVLLDAAAEVGASVVVAGRGPLAARARAEAEHRGWVEGAELERFFADIDCLVVPSVWAEPAGLVVVEAAARGVPVIASASGGLPEYVPASCRPLLTPPGSRAALADALRRFAADPGRYTVGRSDVRTWDEHLEAVLDAYAEARRVT